MDEFLTVYRNLRRENIERIRDIYTADIQFIDPAHEIHGIDALLNYFERLYTNVGHVAFEFHHPVTDGSDGYVQWNMQFSHPRLKRGREILVPGSSFLRFARDGRAYFHRDYFDIGALLYEHLPVVGSAVSFIKRGLGR